MSKKGKVLLFTPNLVGIKDGLNRIQPPLGLMIIAQVLINDGHEVKIVDTALEGWENRTNLGNQKEMIGLSDKNINNIISEFDPDIIGVSVLFSNLNYSAHTIAEIAKKYNPKIKVILGGNHITNSLIDYQHRIIHPGENEPIIRDLENLNFDFAMSGESEFNFTVLVNKIMNNEDPYDTPGIVYRV